MAGHLELRNDADAAIAGVAHQFARVVLRVEEAVGALGGQFGKELALDAKALVVDKVPVEDVQLHGSHGVDVALQNVERLEMPDAIDHQAAPAKARSVVDGDGGHDIDGAGRLHQLHQRLHGMNCADSSGRMDVHARGIRLQHVRLVFVDALHKAAIGGDGDGEGSLRAWSKLPGQRLSCLVLKPLERAQGCGLQPR